MLALSGVIDGHELRLLLEGFEDGKVAPGEVSATYLGQPDCKHFPRKFLLVLLLNVWNATIGL